MVPLRPKGHSAVKARINREQKAQVKDRAISDKTAREKEKMRRAAQDARDWLSAQPKTRQKNC